MAIKTWPTKESTVSAIHAPQKQTNTQYLDDYCHYHH